VRLIEIALNSPYKPNQVRDAIISIGLKLSSQWPGNTSLTSMTRKPFPDRFPCRRRKTLIAPFFFFWHPHLSKTIIVYAKSEYTNPKHVWSRILRTVCGRKELSKQSGIQAILEHFDYGLDEDTVILAVPAQVQF